MAISQGKSSALSKDLKPLLTGTLILPEDDLYEEARHFWSGTVNKYPAAIARCATAEDVVQVVRYGRSQGLPLSVRGGGHDYAGRASCEEGIIIDLSLMRAVTIDAENYTARAQGGAKVGDLINASVEKGLVTSSGNVHTVGLAGLTLGGGYGPLVGKYGLLADNLISVDIVTADGNLRTASATENPDLFWALRGGGGNFGAVVSLEYRLYPFPYPQVQAGLLIYTLNQAKEAYHAFGEFVRTAPDELTILTGFAHLPDGTPFMFVSPTYCGSLEEGAEVLKPLRTAVQPFMDQIQPTPYEVHLRSIDPLAPYGRNYYIATRTVRSIEAGVIDAVIHLAQTFPSPGTALSLHHFHGAASRVPATDTAFALRQDHFVAEIIGAWDDPAEEEKNLQWARGGAESLVPYAFPGGYVNFMGVEEQNRVPLAYGPNYARLLEVKRAYDPEDVFRHSVGHIVPTLS